MVQRTFLCAMRVAVLVVLWVVLSVIATPILGALLALSGQRRQMARQEPDEPPRFLIAARALL